MESLFDKSCEQQYLEKYSKNGNLLRTAEKYENCWIVHQYSGKNNFRSGEYTFEDFNEIRNNYFSN